MLQAIIFDCDGVIVDSEGTHFGAFRAILADENIPLTREVYDQQYLAMDDKGCFETVLRAHDRPVDNATLKRLILKKKAEYERLSGGGIVIYPGVTDFVQKAVGRYRLAIASGAFRGEIKAAIDFAGIRSAFEVIVSAQDVRRGKPDPESYLTALARLNERTPSSPAIQPDACVVIEDSFHGIQSARGAGMRCLAVTNSYPRAKLEGLAHHVVSSLSEVTPDDLDRLCQTSRTV
jgi:HAD superfamily hydrolase (TIGR01509 family)